MSVTQQVRPQVSFQGMFEAAAFLSPIILFGLLATIRVAVFVDTGSLVAILNAAGLTVLTMVFVLRRPAKAVDRSVKSLLAALVGNFLPFALILRDPNDWAGKVPVAIGVITLLLAIWTVLSLRTSMGITPANRGVKTGGPYRFIRHPLYTLVIISQIGVLLQYPSVINCLILGTAIVFKALMIRNEERVLRNDPTYVAYAERVRYRVIPGLI